MTSETEQPEKIEVDTTKTTSGKVTFFGKISNPTPTLLARITKALRYFAVSLITMISGTDLLSGGQAKITNFCLGVFILALGCVDIVIGVEPENKNPYSAPNDDEYKNK